MQSQAQRDINMARKKKYNKMKGALACARAGLKNLAVFHSQIDENEKYTAHMLNFKTGRCIDVGYSMAQAVSKIRHLWNIHLIAVGVESNGKSRFEVEEVKLTESLLQSQLVDYLNEAHEALAESFRERNTLTNLCWLAVPNGDSISNEQIDNILTVRRAWTLTEFVS